MRVLRLSLGVALVSGLIGSARPAVSPVHADTGLITLTVFAYDRKDNPASDLNPNDIRLSDAGHPQQIVCLRLNRARTRQPVIILFDLLNSRMSVRANAKDEIVTSLRHIESTDNLYVYILTKHATIFPVVGVESYEGPPIPPNVPLVDAIKPLLDNALKRLQEFRPVDMEDPDLRLQATMRGLTAVAAHVSDLPGRKSIVWISHGVPIEATWNLDAYMAGISRLCAQLLAADVAVYAVHESVDIGAHMDSGEFLDQFTGLTGGVTFATDNTEAAISQALADARLNYTVTYRPTGLWDGKFHKLELKSRRSGIKLRTIKGYYAIPVTPAQ